MAGGNTPRQKMINLMYLVFIAMLAMNMSKKVLSSFGYSMEKLKASNTKVQQSNAGIIESLASKAAEQPEKYSKKYTIAQNLNGISNTYFSYLDEVMTTLTENVEDTSDYESMDGDQVVNEYLFAKSSKVEGALSEKGQVFLDNMNKYRTDVLALIGDSNPDLAVQIEKRFATDDEVSGSNKKKTVSYMSARYEGFPLVTTLNNIVQIQADVRSTETDTYNSMLGKSLIEDASLNNYQGIVALDKTAYFSGETVTGKIVMGKYDPTFKPSKFESNVNGKVEAGQVNLNFRAGNPGTHAIKGKFVFKQKDGEDIEVPFDSEYTVITEPSSAVISADKMNVVYRGLSNPISISVPGVGHNNVKATAPGLQNKGGGKYVMKPTTGKSVTINVRATLSSGKVINTPKKFRIMDIPAPQGAVRGQTGTVSMPKASLAKASVSSVLKDFVFDLTLRTTGFKVRVPGQATIVVNGGRMNAKAQNAINKARKGDQVAIFDIKSTIVGDGAGMRIKQGSTVLVDIK